MIHRSIFLLILFFLVISCAPHSKVGDTEILKWKDGKKGAISITYDDGSPNQFRNAVPIMNRLGLPATFFIVTGKIPGSENLPKFTGRPVDEIIKETANIPTDKENFFERASAVAYSGYKGTWEYHLEAGSLYETGKPEEAYKIIDEAYAKIRAGELEPGKDVSREAGESSQHTWDDYKEFASQGYEFGSHTITHPRLAVLDRENMLYELEGSREDILHNLGPEHTFSVEGPFGTTNERVMENLLDIYPTSRNRMPQSWLQEIHRGEETAPGASDKEYVQWQRGALTDVPMDTMKWWVDKVLKHNDLWLVLVFHGVDGIGWQPRTSEDLATYFEYIKEREDELWVATFGDVSKYIRQRMNTDVRSSNENDKIVISLSQTLDRDTYMEPGTYDLDLTLKTYVSDQWSRVAVNQGDRTQNVQVHSDDSGRFIIYHATPNTGAVELSKASSSSSPNIRKR